MIKIGDILPKEEIKVGFYVTVHYMHGDADAYTEDEFFFENSEVGRATMQKFYKMIDACRCAYSDDYYRLENTEFWTNAYYMYYDGEWNQSSFVKYNEPKVSEYFLEYCDGNAKIAKAIKDINFSFAVDVTCEGPASVEDISVVYYDENGFYHDVDIFFPDEETETIDDYREDSYDYI